MRIVAIDPGSGGGIAWSDYDGRVDCIPMPKTMTDMIDWLSSFKGTINGTRAVVEKVGTYMPGNSGPAAATFARHCGHIEAALYALGIPTAQVLPKAWQSCIPGLPERPVTKGMTSERKRTVLAQHKSARKRAIQDEMARRFPHIRVTLKTADALGVLEWASRQP